MLEEATRTTEGKALDTVKAVLACRRDGWHAVSIDRLEKLSRNLPPPRRPESQERVDLVRELRARGTNGKHTVWDTVLEVLGNGNGEIPPHSFATWFRPMHCLGLLDRFPPQLVVQVASEQARAWVDKSYGPLIASALVKAGADPSLETVLVTSEEVAAAEKPP